MKSVVITYGDRERLYCIPQLCLASLRVHIGYRTQIPAFHWHLASYISNCESCYLLHMTESTEIKVKRRIKMKASVPYI